MDAVLRRRPEVVLVAELARANVPGSRTARRRRDVGEFPAAVIRAARRRRATRTRLSVASGGGPARGPGHAAAEAAPPVVQELDEIPPLLADPPPLERVIAEPVSNAARYAPPEHPVPITASALAGRIELRIAGRGPDLPPEDRRRAFEPFQWDGDPHDTTGIGLVLAPARGPTEAMEGSPPEDTPRKGPDHGLLAAVPRDSRRAPARSAVIRGAECGPSARADGAQKGRRGTSRGGSRRLVQSAVRVA
ncbi:ATP-binding protein [Streptomyces sp. NPDC007883]|uniref:ATP-binding protein n=1 Tax=Streptomyces sp. NPDC007883 TaxID=3155116 RepID=UPI0033CEF994